MANYRSKRERTVAQSRTIDLNRVQIFANVIEEGSFTGAAKRLSLPKSSVSRNVSLLEKTLGVRLIQRTTRALTLTDVGRTYFAHIQPALASLSDSTATAQDSSIEPRGRVRLTCAPNSEMIISEYVTEFREKYPLVMLEVSFTSRHVDLVAEGFDLALRAGVLKDSSLIARKVTTTEIGLFASPAYLKKHGTPATVAELDGHNCIAYPQNAGRVTWVLKGPKGEETAELNGVVATDLPEFAVSLALGGVGIAQVPTLFVFGAVQEGRLVRVLPHHRREGGDAHLVWPSRTFEPRAVTLFREGLFTKLTAVHNTCDAAVRKQKSLTQRMKPNHRSP